MYSIPFDQVEFSTEKRNVVYIGPHSVKKGIYCIWWRRESCDSRSPKFMPLLDTPKWLIVIGFRQC